MSDNEMRAAFESWLKSEYPQEAWRTSRYLEDDGSDQYIEDFVQGAWVAWQAQRPVLTDEQVRDIAEKAIADISDGLWVFFDADTARAVIEAAIREAMGIERAEKAGSGE